MRSHTLAAAALLALAACAPREEPETDTRPASEAPAGVLRVARDSSGKTLTLRAGSRLEVALESNPTTGYSWQRDGGDSTILARAGEPRFEAENPQPGVVGAGGTEVLAFRAAAPGRTRLILAYRQPWKGGAASGERWEAEVVVRP